jgi:hypothetical protein
MSLLAFTSALTIFCTVAGRFAITSGRVSSVVPCTSPPIASSVPFVVNMSISVKPLPCFVNDREERVDHHAACTESFSRAIGIVLPPVPIDLHVLGLHAVLGQQVAQDHVGLRALAR